MKLATHNIKLEDQVAAKVERRLKALNIETQAVSFEICGGPHFSM